VRFLDNVLDYFIEHAPAQLNKAVYSAMRERAIGIGLMGFHSYLQSKMVPMESAIAKAINIKMFEHIKEQAQEATELLAYERGPCLDARDAGLMVRNSHLLAIAPNTSPGIEPFRANVFNQKTMSGTFMLKNRHLERILTEFDMNHEKVWNGIMANKGSIQHLDLPDHVKDVFKTAIEIDQRWLVEHGGDRQKYICQSQSLNLFFPAEVDKSILHKIHMMAWEKGLKSLYYLRSETIKRSDDLSKTMDRYNFDFNTDEEGCLACEG
jgi:ribonucleoside-diphosphate reductase alpha chain